MTRWMLTLAIAAGLSACAASTPDGGVANYDALKAARDKCAAQGGTLTLTDQGDARRIDAYTCERK